MLVHSNRFLAILSLVLLAAATCGGGFAGAAEAVPESKYPGGKVDVKITAKELVREFVANAEKTKAKYKDKTLRVEGVISRVSIEKSADETSVFVYLEGDATSKVETVIFGKEAANLKEGQSVAIFGAEADYASGDKLVTLFHCELAKK